MLKGCDCCRCREPKKLALWCVGKLRRRLAFCHWVEVKQKGGFDGGEEFIGIGVVNENFWTLKFVVEAFCYKVNKFIRNILIIGIK